MKKRIKLTINELAELKGGTQLMDYITKDSVGAVVKNKNTVNTCVCNFKNQDVIKNINKADYCQCKCNYLPIPSKIDLY
ncbi:MAG: hypothetical protein LBV74_20785 [Tannerella sp.]|jgi:hypothetical protein|nr:hypothetical protein [Tannerella sp.]